MAMKRYAALLHRHGDSYGVSFPDFPGCITAGLSRNDARRRAHEVLALHIQGMIEDGNPLPTPTPIGKVATDSEDPDPDRILVEAQIPD